MSELSSQDLHDLALYELHQEQNALVHTAENPEVSTHTAKTAEPIDKIAVIKFLLVAFAYGWWLIIVVYFGLFAEGVSLHYQVMSLPIVVVALGLARVFHTAINQSAYAYAFLFFSGLLVAGMLS